MLVILSSIYLSFVTVCFGNIQNYNEADFNTTVYSYNYGHDYPAVDRQGGVTDLTEIESEIEEVVGVLERIVTEENERRNGKILRDLVARLVAMVLLSLYRNSGLELDDDGEDSSHMRSFKPLIGDSFDEDGTEIFERIDVEAEARLFQNGHVPQFPGEPLRHVDISYLIQLLGRNLNSASFAAQSALRLTSETTAPCGKHTWRGLLETYSFLRYPWISSFGSGEHEHYSARFSNRINEELACLSGAQQYNFHQEARQARIRFDSLLGKYKIIINSNLKNYERKSDPSSLDDLVRTTMMNLYEAVDEAKEALEKDKDKRQNVFGQLLMHKMNGWMLLTLGRNLANHPNDGSSLFEVPVTHWYQALGNVITYARFSIGDFENLVENYRLDYSDPSCGNGPLYHVMSKYSYLLYGASTASTSLDMMDMKMEIKLALCCLLNQGSADISTLTGQVKSSALDYRITEFISAVQTRLDNS